MIRHMTGYPSWRVLTSSNAYFRLISSSSSSFQELKTSIIHSSKKGLANKGASEKNSSLVAAAFKSLKEKNPDLEERLQSARNVEDVLSITNVPNFSQYHALQALSILAEWTSSKKITMKDIETDPRFIHLAQSIGTKQKETVNDSNIGDLSVVMEVTGEDQAVKLVDSISFTQKIRVMSTLAFKKRRSIHLLKAISTKLCNNSQIFDLKQAADVLYAMSCLNFLDRDLIKKAFTDIKRSLPENKKPAVVGSILTSIGILKIKNTELLNMLSEWIGANIIVCREQDIVALLLTLASVNYSPPNAVELCKIILPVLSSESLRPNVWLDVVWALSILNFAETNHLHSVLSPDFIKKLTHSGYLTNIPAPAQRKLLHLNGVAQSVVKNYPGPLLADKTSFQFPLQHTREKQKLVDSVIDSLRNLLPSPTYLQTNVDTSHGFLIDGVCALDAKFNPLPVDNSSTVTEKRIAVVVCDYHDMCRESEELTGPVILQMRILKCLGYKVMIVSHLEFKPKEKLVSRVKYLEKKLKNVAAH